jgi:hypothetical protein
MKDYLLLMEPQGQIKSISIAVVQAGGKDALEHSSNLLLDPFNADRHEHICQRNSSRSVENCRQEGRRFISSASGRNVCLRALLYAEYARGHGDIKCASSILT